MDDNRTPEEIIEKAIGELYRGYYRLRQQHRYQDEYDEMGVLLNMLLQDRAHLREKYIVKN